MSAVKDKITIITDSIAGLTPEIISRYKLQIMPINIHLDGKIYRDGVDLTINEAYRMLERDAVHFASSPASIGEYMKVFQAVSTQSEGILVIAISTKLSTLFNVANLAKEQIIEKLPQVPIEVLDSRSATVGEGLIVTAAAQAAKTGKSLAEVTRIAKNVSTKIRVEGVLDTIRYVYRTGRIPRFPAKIGSMLNIKPIFSISEGSVHLTGVSRDRQKAIEGILARMRQEVNKRPVHLAIAHADALEAGARLKEEIESEFNCAESWLTDFSPVMAYATGPGVLVIAYYTDN